MKRLTRHRLLTLIGLLLAGLAVYLAAGRYLTLEQLVAQELRLRNALDAWPWRGLALVFVLYTLLSMVPGLTGKSIVCGWLLGFGRGLIVVSFGLTIAASIAFLISRYLIRDYVRTRFTWFMRRLRYRMRGGDGTFLLTLRLLHAPFTLTNYAVGATDVGLWRFWWTTQLGMLPANIAFVLAGAGIPSLHELQVEGLWSIVNLPLLAALTVVGLVPLAIRWAVRRNLKPADYHIGDRHFGSQTGGKTGT